MATLFLLCLSVWRISSPTGVPPGSRNTRTRYPSPCIWLASNSICVDLPQPSVPSKVMNGAFTIFDLRFMIHDLHKESNHEIRETHERNFPPGSVFRFRVIRVFRG